MRRLDAIRQLRSRAEAIRGFGATSLYLFGSTARDEDRGESDVDLFIDYDPESGFSLIELVGLKQFLEQQLQVPVDVTTRDSLHPRLRATIERSAERVF